MNELYYFPLDRISSGTYLMNFFYFEYIFGFR